MLTLHDEKFTSGAAAYFENDPSVEEGQSSIHVNVILNGEQPITIFARIDPATPWVVLNADLNEQLGLRATSTETKLQTAAGLMQGCLVRLPITLPADQGDHLEIEATLFVCDDWHRENFLGYSGFLERLRFAVDPSSRTFYFGSAS